MSETGVGAARQHLAAAMEALGVAQPPAGEAEFVRRTVERVRRARPGVPAHQALAVIETLRAMQWGPPAPACTVELEDDPRLRARDPLPPVPDRACAGDGTPTELRESAAAGRDPLA